MSEEAALVLFSGGQDSTVCLAWALERFERVETIGFAYGQRHLVELTQRPVVRSEFERSFPRWGARLGDDHVLELATLGQISDTALTRDAQFEMTAAGLPNTFVPGRNLLFFTYAAALAYRRGIRTLVGGMCETDFSGYPDCRNETLQSLARSISLGMDAPFRIETPLMWIDKAATWAMGEELGGKALIDLIIEHTHTCYTPDRTTRHAWGYGCGQCPACALRAKGWERWTAEGAADHGSNGASKQDELLRVFAQRLKEARKRAGFGSAAEFAFALGVEPPAYRHWERGRSQPSLEMVSRMCLILRVSPNELLPFAATADNGPKYEQT